MNGDPDWLPDLLQLSDHSGKWQEYCDAVYAVFNRDFISSQPQLDGQWVRCRRDPLYDGKEAGFWHCVQQGADEEARISDTQRCERIAWIRAIIEHASESPVERWTTTRGSDSRCVLWFREEYVVILGNRTSRHGREYKQLITAYCTDRDHTKRKLRKERDKCKNG